MTLDFLSLEEAARELGATPQGVVLLARQHGLEVQRLERQGRTLSGINRSELEYLAGHLEDPAAPARKAPAVGLEDRLLETRRQLEEARLEAEVGRQACERLAQETARCEGLEARVAELVAELEAEREAARAAAAHQEEAERQLSASKAEREQLERGSEQALEAERERTEAARAERLAVERRLANELSRMDELRRRLTAADELESSNARYLDHLEQKLAVAHQTIDRLRQSSRRPA